MKLLSVQTRSQLKMGTVLTSKKLNGMRLYQTVLSPIRKCRVEAHRRIQTAGYHNYLTVSVPGVCSGYFSQCSLSWGGQGDFLLPLAFLIRSFTLEGKWQLISDVIGPVCWENVSPNSLLVFRQWSGPRCHWVHSWIVHLSYTYYPHKMFFL